ncbi:MAG: hypothetical protein JNL58_30590 [Planctomyces sp.]|nr:hypothetical protein [Planctomyces sp.]
MTDEPGFLVATEKAVFVGSREKTAPFSCYVQAFAPGDGSPLGRIEEIRHKDQYRENASCGPRGIPAVVPDGIVYLARNGNFVCASVNSSHVRFHERWRVNFEERFGVFFRDDLDAGTPGISPKVIGTKVLTATGNGSTHNMHDREKRIPAPTAPAWICCEMQTGVVLWSNSDPSRSVLHSTNSSPVSLDQRNLIASGGDGRLYVLQMTTGRTLAVHDGAFWSWCSPVVVGSNVIVATSAPPGCSSVIGGAAIVSLTVSVKNGSFEFTENWRYSANDYTGTWFEPVLNGPFLFVLSSNSDLIAIDVKTGKRQPAAAIPSIAPFARITRHDRYIVTAAEESFWALPSTDLLFAKNISIQEKLPISCALCQSNLYVIDDRSFSRYRIPDLE